MTATEPKETREGQNKKGNCQRLGQKKKMLKEAKTRQLQRERSRRYRQRVKAGISNEPRGPQDVELDETLSSPFSNRMAKKRQLDKVKEVLPSTPGKKAEIVVSLGSSPRTRKILCKKGMLRTPEEEKEVLALKAMAEDLKEGIGQVKKDNSKTGRAAFGAMKSLTFGRNVKKRRAQKRLAKTLALDRRSVKAGINKREQLLKGEEINWLTTKRQVRKDALSEDVKERVYNFWTFSASRPTGGKKDKCRKRVGKKVWTEHAKHVLQKTQTEAYLDFKQNNPEIKISQRCFEQLKPYFVKPARERDRLTCMCRQHVELKIVFDACMRYRKSILADSEIHEVNVYSHLGDLVKESLCPLDDESRYNRMECIQRVSALWC